MSVKLHKVLTYKSATPNSPNLNKCLNQQLSGHCAIWNVQWLYFGSFRTKFRPHVAVTFGKCDVSADEEPRVQRRQKLYHL